MTPIRQQLETAALDARKQRDRRTASVFRSALTAIANAEAMPVDTAPAAGALEEAPVSAEVPRRELSEDEMRGHVQAEADERRAAAQALAGPRPEDAQALVAEAALLEALLAEPTGPA